MLLLSKDSKIVNIMLHFIGDGAKRAAYLKKKRVFYHMGENCFYQPKAVPTESCLISMGNNVSVAAGVGFITHDIVHRMFNQSQELSEKYGKSKFYMGKIEIGDNVMIGQGSIIRYDVKIGNNVVIAAGSVVVSDIPDNSVFGGNPARFICDFDKFAIKRMENIKDMPTKKQGVEVVTDYFWK